MNYKLLGFQFASTSRKLVAQEQWFFINRKNKISKTKMMFSFSWLSCLQLVQI